MRPIKDALKMGALCPAAICAASITTPSLALTNSVGEAQLHAWTQSVNTVLGLSESSLQDVNIRGQIDQIVNASVQIEGELYVLDLIPHSVRADNYELRVQLADGSIQVQQPAPSKTMRGRVRGMQGGIVAGSLLDDGLYATIILNTGDRYWIEPVSERVPGVPASLHAVYPNGAVISDGVTCGTNAQPAAGGMVDLAQGGVAGATGLEQLCTVELANDADVEYFETWESVEGVEERIEMITNTMNVQYETEVGITHVITTNLVRTSEPDPYSSFENNDLLCQFIVEWTNNQPDIERDVAQLFTGREIEGTVIGQAAEIGSICDPQGCTEFPCDCLGFQGTKGSYCFSQSDYNGTFACATDLSAHELGHLWGGSHCSCSDPDFTMNPGITCANTFNPFETIPGIIGYRNSRPCLDCVTEVAFEFPEGIPTVITPPSASIPVVVVAGTGSPEPGTGKISVDAGSGFETSAMSQPAPDEYLAELTDLECPNVLNFFFLAESDTGVTATSPLVAPTDTYSAIVADETMLIFDDDFDDDLGWTVTNSPGLGDGAWERGVPIGGGDRGDPPTDADGSGFCFVTDNEDGNSDVDDGSTTITSPIMDATLGTPVVSYHRWYDNTVGDAPMDDVFTVEVSDNGGDSWSILEIVGPDGDDVSGGWFFRQFLITDAGIELTDEFRIRFTAEDAEPGSVVEAGVDGVQLTAAMCKIAVPCPADLDGSGAVGPGDLAQLLGVWGPAAPVAPADLDGSGNVGPGDLAVLLGTWGPCPK